jgi:hypothetical protein
MRNKEYTDHERAMQILLTLRHFNLILFFIKMLEGRSQHDSWAQTPTRTYLAISQLSTSSQNLSGRL